MDLCGNIIQAVSRQRTEQKAANVQSQRKRDQAVSKNNSNRNEYRLVRIIRCIYMNVYIHKNTFLSLAVEAWLSRISTQQGEKDRKKKRTSAFIPKLSTSTLSWQNDRNQIIWCYTCRSEWYQEHHITLGRLTHLLHNVRRENPRGEGSAEDIWELLVQASDSHPLKIPFGVNDGLSRTSRLCFTWREQE